MLGNHFKLHRHFLFVLVLLVTAILVPGVCEAGASAKRTIEPGLTVSISGGKTIRMTACAGAEQEIADWASRILADPSRQSKYMSRGCLVVPLSALSDEYQLEAINTLFRSDTYGEKDWIHKVTYTSRNRQGGETLWNISQWFTGDATNYKKIMKYNGMSRRARVYRGTKIRIPLYLLRPAFKEPILYAISARRAAEGPSAEAKRLNGDLTLKTDALGAYASYKMKKGDTIYSKIVVQYTGRVTSKDVMDAVDIILRRSSIRNPKKLRPGHEIKIPLDLLSLQYLPPDDPRRQEYEGIRRDALKHSNPVRTAELEGIAVILDSGHGGGDPGAIGKNRLYEDEMAYDVLCRIKRLLERETMATVVPTIIDTSQQYVPRDWSSFPNDRDEVLLTNPTYKNHNAKVSVNLRWYLVNSISRKLTANGTDPDEVVFISLHADSLHPKVSGAMIYIPGTYYCKGSGGKRGKVYDAHAEVREKRYVRLSYDERVRSEGFSGEFAKILTDSLKDRNIQVHSQKPIRNHIVRGRHSYVPAVIRHNIVPTKILVEIGNLMNSQDSKMIADYRFRERFAAAVVDALKEYYGGK
jgi:N-acetylmuramoyl-L-alanine amidase